MKDKIHEAAIKKYFEGKYELATAVEPVFSIKGKCFCYVIVELLTSEKTKIGVNLN